MSENTETTDAHALLCFTPTSASSLNSTVDTTSCDPYTSLSSNPHTSITYSSASPPTMGNQQSGEGSLRRRKKNKNKNKNEDKNKGENPSLFEASPVEGAYGGSPVDCKATASKRKPPAQTKSPRPVRSTYDNVNQPGSVASLCDNAMYTSDLFLDTVSRLDVSMTASQTEAALSGERRHQFDPQTADNLSFGEASLPASGFITPALGTPHVKRSGLHHGITTDSVSELGKEIERTIFERLSANQKSGNNESKPEKCPTTSDKTQKEVEMIPGENTPKSVKKLEYVNDAETYKQTTIHCTAQTSNVTPAERELDENNGNKSTTHKEESTKAKLETDLKPSETTENKQTAQSMENERKSNSSEIINKADWELMEKESKSSECNPQATVSDQNDLEKAVTVNDPAKIAPNEQTEVNCSSGSDEACYDFETVKLHIDEDFKFLNQEDDYVMVGGDDTTVGRDESLDIEIDQATAGQGQEQGQETQVSAGQEPEPELVVKHEPEPEIDDGKCHKEDDENPKNKENKEKECKQESVASEESERLDSVIVPEPISETETSPLKTLDGAAAAALATKPLDIVKTVTLSEADQSKENTSVKAQAPVYEELVLPSDYASVEQSHIIIRRPISIGSDQEIEIGSKTKALEERVEEMVLDQKPDAEEIPEVVTQQDCSDSTTVATHLDGVKTASEDKGSTEIAKPNTISEPNVMKSDENIEITKTEQSVPGKKARKGRKRKKKRKSSGSEVASGVSSANEGQSVEEVAEMDEYNSEVTTSSSKSAEEIAKEDRDNGNDVHDSDSPLLQHQSSVIERKEFRKKDESNKDLCDLLLESVKSENKRETQELEDQDKSDTNEKNRCPYVLIDTIISARELQSGAEFLSDEATPTNERQNEVRAFYIPRKDQETRPNLFSSPETTKRSKLSDDQSEDTLIGEEERLEEIRRREYHHQQSKEDTTDDGLTDISQKENEFSICKYKKENIIEGEHEVIIVTPRHPKGTKYAAEEYANSRLSTASEELNEIMENTNKQEKSSRPSIFTEQSLDINENHQEATLQDNHDEPNASYTESRSAKVNHLSLTDIDSSLPETLPELADLQNFLDYIKLGDQAKGTETPPFSPRGETGRSSPTENSNSRRLSRISPAITDRSVTESDLDISEQRDDISTDSNIFADDEDESSSELLFTKTYTEPDKGGEVQVSCTVVNTGLDDDSDEFWAESSATEEVYRQIENSTKAVSTVFDNARLQMQDIHSHLQNLRLQMENLQVSLDNASILNQEYYHMDTQVTSEDCYPVEKTFIVTQEYFPMHVALVTTEEYSPADIGPVVTEEYYSSALDPTLICRLSKSPQSKPNISDFN